MRFKRPETIVVEFLAELRQMKRARDEWADHYAKFADDLPFYFYAVRQACGRMTQQELAEELGVDHSYISKVETGKILPKSKHVNKILELLRRNDFTWEGDPFMPAAAHLGRMGDMLEEPLNKKTADEVF